MLSIVLAFAHAMCILVTVMILNGPRPLIMVVMMMQTLQGSLQSRLGQDSSGLNILARLLRTRNVSSSAFKVEQKQGKLIWWLFVISDWMLAPCIPAARTDGTTWQWRESCKRQRWRQKTQESVRAPRMATSNGVFGLKVSKAQQSRNIYQCNLSASSGPQRSELTFATRPGKHWIQYDDNNTIWWCACQVALEHHVCVPNAFMYKLKWHVIEGQWIIPMTHVKWCGTLAPCC